MSALGICLSETKPVANALVQRGRHTLIAGETGSGKHYFMGAMAKRTAKLGA